MFNKHLIINEGKIPILVVSIHSCHANSPIDSTNSKEAQITKELNETLHSKLNYYSFIYLATELDVFERLKNL
ncbi:hypothetical protein HYU21_03890 [Candidatus Woesearchaeota archaeon]|nr:hypothetical protein [Candidatus Woesearchaeota archaeon]